MSGLVGAVRAKLGERADWCCVRRCKANGCEAKIADDLDPRELVDMDRLLPAGDGGRCDFLLVSDRGSWVAPLELKKGQARAGEASRQLQAGAREAEKLVSAEERTQFRPVVVSGEISRHDLNLLKQQKVSFRGRKATAVRIRCGEYLSQGVLNRIPSA